MRWFERLEAHALLRKLDPAASVFHFVRHGETAENRARICQGQNDVPLNADGMAQAKRAAPLLAALPVKRLVASDLRRVQMTIAPLLAATGWPMEKDAALRERCFGPRQGRPLEDDHWEASEPGVETIEDFVQRICDCLQRELHEDHVLLAAHGGVLRVIAAALDAPLQHWAYTNALPMTFRRNGGAWSVEAMTPEHRLDALAPLPEGVTAGDPTTAADLNTAPVT